MSESKARDVVVTQRIVEVVKFRIVGTSPLVQHGWSAAARQLLIDTQTDPTKKHKEKVARDIEAEWRGALYEFADGGFGHPSGGFLKAMVRAAKGGDYTMVDAKTMFTVVPDGYDKSDMRGLVRIEGEPHMVEHIVRIKRSGVYRVRPMFDEWGADVSIRFNKDKIRPDQLGKMLADAGQFVGIGEGRPETGCGLDWGKWQIAST